MGFVSWIREKLNFGKKVKKEEPKKHDNNLDQHIGGGVMVKPGPGFEPPVETPEEKQEIPKDVLPAPVEEPEKQQEAPVEVPAEIPSETAPAEVAPVEVEVPVENPIAVEAPAAVPAEVTTEAPVDQKNEMPFTADQLPSELKPFHKDLLKLAWMVLAVKELLNQVTEVPGPKNNPRVVWYHSFCTLRAKEDSVPWCAAFVNAMLIVAGFIGTGQAWARSFLSCGKKLRVPKLGCIVVLTRGMSKTNGHVGFYITTLKNGKILILGGNQDDKVCLKVYDADRVLGYRWPEQKAE